MAGSNYNLKVLIGNWHEARIVNGIYKEYDVVLYVSEIIEIPLICI